MGLESGIHLTIFKDITQRNYILPWNMSRLNYDALQKPGEANCFKFSTCFRFSTQKFYMAICREVTFYSSI